MYHAITKVHFVFWLLHYRKSATVVDVISPAQELMERFVRFEMLCIWSNVDTKVY